MPPTSILDNAADAKVDGVEMETVIMPSDRFSVNLAATYLNSRYGNYLPGTGEDFSGNRLNRSPEWTVKTGAEWRIPMDGFFSRLTLRGELNYTDRIYFLASNDRAGSQPSTVITNAYVTLDSDDRGLTVRGYVTNIGNVDAITAAIDSRGTSGSIQGYWNQPRVFGVEFTKAF